MCVNKEAFTPSGEQKPEFWGKKKKGIRLKGTNISGKKPSQFPITIA